MNEDWTDDAGGDGRGVDHGVSKWLQREESHSRHVLSTAKLVTTFSAATAATFVATALQSGEPSCQDQVAATLMLVSLGLTVWVVVTPRKSDVKIEHLQGQSPMDVQAKLVCAAQEDAERARLVYRLMVAQIAFAFAASLFAGVGLLAAVGMPVRELCG